MCRPSISSRCEAIALTVEGEYLDFWTQIAALWGAVLSTALGMIAVLQFRNRRLRFVSGYVARDSGGYREGHEIAIYNPSPTPALITSWELCRSAKKLFTWEDERIAPEYDDVLQDIFIEPYGKKVLEFTEALYFPMSYFDGSDGKALTLVLWVGDRKKPVRLRVSR